MKTDENGRAQLNTGLGDLLVWAKQGDDYAYAQLDLRKQDHLVLILSDKGPNPWMSAGNLIQAFDMVPPVGKPVVNNVSASAQMACDKRLAKEDKMREAYRATFPTKAQTAKYKNDYFNEDEFYDVVHRSEGNHVEIIKFLQSHPKRVGGLYLKEFVNTLADKDLRDTKAEILEKQLTVYKEGKYPISVFVRGILPARISNELIRDWRLPLREEFVKAIPNSVITANKLLDWTKKNITVDPLCNYYNCPISPMGVMKTRRADGHSRDIFFVAACRSLDIPCFLDNASNIIYVWQNGDWQEITFEEESVTPLEDMATLTLHNPKGYTYYIHYTLQRFENGEYVSYDFENDPRVEKPHIELILPPGKYCLSTGNRYSDGTTRSRLEFFNLPAGKEVKKQLTILPLVKRDVTYGTIRTDYELSRNGKQVKVSELMKDKEMLVCFIDPTREPTKHLLNEIVALRGEFEAWGGSILFMVPTSRMAADFDFKAWKLPRQSVMIEDVNDLWFNEIITSTDQYFRDNYPVVYLIQPDGTIVFKSEGYNIGTGHLILNSAK